LLQYPPISFALRAVFGPLVAVALASCVDHSQARVAFAATDPTEEAAADRAQALSLAPASDGRVVLVTVDGVRAEDVFGGADRALRPGSNIGHLTSPEALMPRTHALVATRGVALGADQPGCGVVRTASGANVSLPGYLEIFTGRRTRCRDNRCARTRLRTVLDEAADAGLAPVASIGSWEVLDRAVTRGSSPVLVAEGAQRWPGSRPLVDERLEAFVSAGEHAEAFPGGGRYRPDAYTSAIALEYLRTAAPPVLHVGLGDADEWGHRNDYPAYLEAIGRADAFIGQVADTLDAMGDVGARTTVIITTDHGRNRDFQHHGASSLTSARTFVIAFGARVASRGVVCPARDVTLADVAPTIRALIGLPAETAPDAGRPIAEIVATRPTLVARRLGVYSGERAGAAGGSQRP
jgi:hypothetical protein